MATATHDEELERIKAEIQAEAERKIREAEEQWKSQKVARDELAKLEDENAKLTEQINANLKRINELRRELGLATRGRRTGGRRSAVDRDELKKTVKRVVNDATSDGMNAKQLSEHRDVQASVQTVRSVLDELIKSGDVFRAGQRRGTKFFGKPWQAEAEAPEAGSAA